MSAKCTFKTNSGQVRLTDFMPVRPRAMDRDEGDGRASCCILRLVEGLAGDVEFAIDFRPTFDYARATTEVTLRPAGAVARAGDESLTLSCPTPLPARTLLAPT